MIDESESNPRICWPDWILRPDPELSQILKSISSIYERLQAAVRGGYSYKHVWNKQINKPIDQMVTERDLSEEAMDSPSGRAFFTALTYETGETRQMLERMTFCSVLSVTKLLNGVSRGAGAGDLLVPFVCLRGVIEHIAQYHTVIHKIRTHQVPASFDESRQVLAMIKQLLIKASYGTHIAWEALGGSKAGEPIEQTQIAYKPRENRENLWAKSTLNSIDSLEKVVKETRAVYDVLCEFTHPNVGALFLFTESGDLKEDKQGVWWVNKRLTPEAPSGLLKHFGSVCRSIFKNTERCLNHFETLRSESTKQEEKILEITQKVVRQMVASNKNVFDVYSPCPCGSGNKLKFCCAKYGPSPAS